jgi:hypothetical protein
MASLRLRVPSLGIGLIAFLSACRALAGSPPPAPPAESRPDPSSVERYETAYRYPQAGWIVLHIEGEPYDRGFQHGRLLAPEIADFVKALAAYRSPAAPADGWRDQRLLVNALFLRRYDAEYLEEMRGIADGATAAGARFEGRRLDLLDIAAINSDIEVAFLDDALDATATGLEGRRFRGEAGRPPRTPAPEHCSAFAATGPATKDGKVVFGHITMWNLYHTRHYNIWLDVKPARGHRVLMQTYPGGIMSGLDYYMNDHGLLVAETTIKQTKFDARGTPLATRIRKALQYADTIDDAVGLLRESNNGLYTNEWLLADTNTNEIAMFELGTHQSKLWRSSKHDWYGGTEGFYWGCNNPKDLDVRLETVPGLDAKPANVVFHQSERDRTWIKLYEEAKGRISAEFGFDAFTTPPLAAFASCDAKFTTSDMAKQLKTFALFGPPLGRTWDPSPAEKARYRDIQPLIPNDWTLLSAERPAAPGAKVPMAFDLAVLSPRSQPDAGPEGVPPPAWRGTILPASDADIWLAAAFADYERIAALEKALYSDGTDRQSIAGSTPSRTRKEKNGDVLFSELTRERADDAIKDAFLSDPDVVQLVDEIEQSHVQLARVQRLVPEREQKHEPAIIRAKKTVDDLTAKWEALWNEREPLYRARLARMKQEVSSPKSEHEQLALALFAPWSAYRTAVRKLGKDVPLSQIRADLKRDEWYQIASGKGVLLLASLRTMMGRARFDSFMDEFGRAHAGKTATSSEFFKAAERAYGKSLESVRATWLDGTQAPLESERGFWSIHSFEEEPEQSLIVYGSLKEAAAQHEAAEILQRGIARRWRNQTVPIKADCDVTDVDLHGRHILLVGRPDTNSTTAKLAEGIPVSFGPGSFQLLGKTYAHAQSAVVAAGDHPHDSRYSLVVFAGLGAEATRSCVQVFSDQAASPAPVLLLEAGRPPRRLTIESSAKALESLGRLGRETPPR